MRYSLLAALFLSACATSTPRSPSSTNPEADFASYVRGYSSPEYFGDNDQAFAARLRLLDLAPPGAKVKIATFLFNNGKVTRELASHLCQAAMRGVKVELLADSKSGDVIHHDDPFDKSDDKQVVEEVYQYLANCGARVYVHNHLTSFIELMGTRLPNIYVDRPDTGVKRISGLNVIELFEFNRRITAMLERIARLTDEEMERQGVRSSMKPLLLNLYNFGFNLIKVLDLTKDATDPNNPPSGLNSLVSTMNGYYLDILRDPFWKKANSAQIRAALPKVVRRFRAHPELGKLRQVIQRYNRLNHRKLFLVENASGSEACFLLGGRNLGDEFLASGEEAHHDGDVIYCRHHSAEGPAMIEAAHSSFRELKEDLSDPMLGLPNDNKVRLVEQDKNVKYKYLRFPASLKPAGARFGDYSGKLSESSRTLIEPRNWSDAGPVHGDLVLANASHWRLLTAKWNPNSDQIMATLLDSIQREQKEIYIETAYAEFNGTLRSALEAALARGVKVRLLTNSFFISDGGSRLIRITMANWIKTIKAKFGPLLDVQFATYAAGHMTHFKFAEFACQARTGGVARMSIIGSHNFHPRSGRADKEHALTFDQPESGGCKLGLVGSDDIQSRRANLYTVLSQEQGAPSTEFYASVEEELTKVRHQTPRHRSAQAQIVAGALRKIFYQDSDRELSLKDKERLSALFELLDASGLHDLFGRFL